VVEVAADSEEAVEAGSGEAVVEVAGSGEAVEAGSGEAVVEDSGVEVAAGSGETGVELELLVGLVGVLLLWVTSVGMENRRRWLSSMLCLWL
jgi:hypothetical protein